jgi:hypothetical protein
VFVSVVSVVVFGLFEFVFGFRSAAFVFRVAVRIVFFVILFGLLADQVVVVVVHFFVVPAVVVA